MSEALIAYEQPLNERVRTLLRLEQLFRQLPEAMAGDSTWHSRAAIATLIDILDLLGRNDLKTELLKELERLKGALSGLRDNPAVEHEVLHQVLAELERLRAALHGNNRPLGHELRRDELLNGLRQRSNLAGAVCGFDLPLFEHWLSRPASDRQAALRTWWASLEVLEDAVTLILRVMRESAVGTGEVAEAGVFQKALESSEPYQLIRVLLPASAGCFPDVSGGRHRITIRFMLPQGEQRPVQTNEAVAFILTCCAV